ncbi:MAG TPA: hypothetical protein VFV19_10620 [Candidatus Polarisedimenticolaceae bacterium]|nr:hypothetical protein [Candidatus Polarisedimenticolaceae bacterium]
MARKKAERDHEAPPTFAARLPLWVGLFAVLVAAFHAFFQIELIDEGVLTMGAWRITQGQIPYRDFFAFYTPGSFYLVALAFKLFGVSLAASRVVAVALGAALVAATAGLALRAIRAPLFATVPVAVLCQAGLGGWPMASHHWIADLGCVAAAWLLLRALDERPFLWSSLAGAAAAVAFWSLTGQGALMAILTAALVLFAVPSPSRRSILTGWSAGIAAVSVPFLFLLLRVDGATLRYDLVTFATTAYKSIEGNRYGFTFPVRELAQQWASGAWRAAPLYTIVVTATSVALWLGPIVAAVLVAVSYAKRWDTAPRRGIIVALALTFVLTVAWRWAPINLQWTAIGPALMIAWALSRWSRKRLAAGIAWAWIAAFAFVGAYRIGMTLSPDGWVALRTPAGTWKSFNKRQASQLQGLVDEIGKRLSPDEPLLCKSVPLVNFMTRHPNPTRFDLFVPPDYTPEPQVREAIATLDRIHLRWIATPAFVPSESLFDRWLLEHYELAWDNGEFGLWQRTAP